MPDQATEQDGCVTGFTGFIACSLLAAWLWNIASDNSPCGSIYNSTCMVCVNNVCNPWSGPSSFASILSEILIVPLTGTGLVCLLYPFHKEKFEPGQLLQILIAFSIPITFLLAAARYWWERGIDPKAHPEAYITLELSSGLMLLALSFMLVVCLYTARKIWHKIRRSS